MRFVLLFCLLNLLVACSWNPRDNNFSVNQSVANQYPGWVTATGFGKTRQVAEQNAKRELSSRLFVSVSDLRSSSVYIHNGNIKRSTSSSNTVYSAVVIDDLSVLDQREKDDGVYVTVGFRKEEKPRIIADTRRKMPALQFVRLISQDTDSVKKIQHALAALALIKTRGLEDDYVTTEKGRFTFKTYFNEVVNTSSAQLTVIYQAGKPMDTLILIDARYIAMKNLNVIIHGKVYTTNQQGKLFIPHTDKTVLIQLDNGRLFKIVPVNKTVPAYLYLSTQPGGILTEVYQGNQYLRSGRTPMKLPVKPGQIEIKYLPDQKFRPMTKWLTVAKNNSAYVFTRFQQRHFGHLVLDTAFFNRVKLYDQNNKLLIDDDNIDTRLDTGSYTAEIYHSGNKRDYQLVTDHFTLRDGETVKRDYASVIDRGYWIHQHVFSLSWGIGASLNPDYAFTLNNSRKTLGDIATLNNMSLDSGFNHLGYRLELTHAYIGAGYEILTSSKDSSTRPGFDASGFSAELGAIFRTDVATFHIGGGYQSGNFKTDRAVRIDNDRHHNQMIDVAYHVPYLEVGSYFSILNKGSFINISVRQYQQMIQPMVFVGISGGIQSSGYHFPSTAEAIKGVHY